MESRQESTAVSRRACHRSSTRDRDIPLGRELRQQEAMRRNANMPQSNPPVLQHPVPRKSGSVARNDSHVLTSWRDNRASSAASVLCTFTSSAFRTSLCKESVESRLSAILVSLCTCRSTTATAILPAAAAIQWSSSAATANFSLWTAKPERALGFSGRSNVERCSIWSWSRFDCSNGRAIR